MSNINNFTWTQLVVFGLALLLSAPRDTVAAPAALTVCPSDCACREATDDKSIVVQCEGLGLADVPSIALPPTASSLDMSRNHLTSLTTSSFVSVRRSLRTLNVSRNRVETVEDGSFGSMQRLEALDLSGNRLTVVRQGTFRGAPGLQVTLVL